MLSSKLSPELFDRVAAHVDGLKVCATLAGAGGGGQLGDFYAEAILDLERIRDAWAADRQVLLQLVHNLAAPLTRAFLQDANHLDAEAGLDAATALADPHLFHALKLHGSPNLTTASGTWRVPLNELAIDVGAGLKAPEHFGNQPYFSNEEEPRA